MPGFNGMGPMGQGSRTGRGLGYCGNGNGAGTVGYGYGRGRGFGRGFGYAGRFQYGVAPVVNENYLENELNAVKQQKAFLEEQERQLNERLQAMNKDSEDNQ